MRATKITLAGTVLTLVLWSANAKADDYRHEDRPNSKAVSSDARKDYDHLSHRLNDGVKGDRGENDAMHAISVETGVPLPKIRDMAHSMHDMAAVATACAISGYTKRDPQTYLDEKRQSKRLWKEMIEDARVPYENVNQKLANVDGYVRGNHDVHKDDIRH